MNFFKAETKRATNRPMQTRWLAFPLGTLIIAKERALVNRKAKKISSAQPLSPRFVLLIYNFLKKFSFNKKY